MQFLPATREALDEYVTLGEPELDDSLLLLGASAARIVPECVGLSLTLHDEELTFTLVRTESAAPGPVDAAVPAAEPPACDAADALLDEETWAAAARDEAASGVASSLSLPMLEDGRVASDVHLYASSAEAFVGRHRALAEALGACAAGAVTNADLAFASRHRAAEAPRRLREQHAVEVGVGLLAAREDLEPETARRRLHDVATRAGLSDVQVARLLVDLHRG